MTDKTVTTGVITSQVLTRHDTQAQHRCVSLHEVKLWRGRGGGRALSLAGPEVAPGPALAHRLPLRRLQQLGLQVLLRSAAVTTLTVTRSSSHLVLVKSVHRSHDQSVSVVSRLHHEQDCLENIMK